MSPARIINGIPRTSLIVFASLAVALAGAVPAAITAVHPLVSGHRAGPRLPRPAAVPPGPAKASLPITVFPAAARPARYPLTAQAARPARYPLTAQAARPARYTLTARAARHIPRTPRQIARQLLGRYHWADRQFRYLNRLWDAESSWDPQAANPESGAYGIPQAVPGSKMAAAGPDWRSSPRTQIRWGMHYIRERYGSPAGAWTHERWYGWY